MCGIIGIISDDKKDHDLLRDMTNILRHRGPDNIGLYHNGNVSLGHRRLSIIDLSSSANQPMFNEDNSIIIVCNGEIYNYKELMDSLKQRGHIFRSQSDCETLVHLYEEYGDEFLSYVNGMFAFCLWDSTRKRMLTAVDRFGKKPLYYAKSNGKLVFASELKSLLILPWINRNIDPQAIDRYLSLRYVPAPMTMFKQIRKMEMASMLVAEEGKFYTNCYWHSEVTDAHTTSEQFEYLLCDAVKLRLRSDVPLGIYLSGGIDSGVIAYLMKEANVTYKNSYTIGFDYKYDERPSAENIATYLDFKHHSLTVCPEHFDLIPKIQYHLDEPFGDLVCLPAYILAHAAKKELTVMITGDGADETLNGYFHHKIILKQNKANKFLKLPVITNFISMLAGMTPCAFLNLYFDYPDKIGPYEREKIVNAGKSSSNFGKFYEAITSCFCEDDKKLLYTNSFYGLVSETPLSAEYDNFMNIKNGFSFLSKLSLLDIKYWIPFTVIYRLDKLNMAHAVETRSPYLDYRLVNTCLNLEDINKVDKGTNKIALRNFAKKMIPNDIRNRKKQAFYMPQVEAYKKRYFTWVDELIDQNTIQNRGLFQWITVNNIIDQARKGSMLACRQLTSLAMLETWFRMNIDNKLLLNNSINIDNIFPIGKMK